MKSKKAMAAVTATVLLIGFAALLGTIVMSWGTTAVDRISADECSRVSITLDQEGENLIVAPKINNIVCREKGLDISNLR